VSTFYIFYVYNFSILYSQFFQIYNKKNRIIELKLKKQYQGKFADSVKATPF